MGERRAKNRPSRTLAGAHGLLAGRDFLVQTSEQIEQLQERLRQLKARQAMVDARRRSLEAQRARKADLRRKHLVGALVLAKVEQGVLPESQLRGWLDATLQGSYDRGLFDL